jgi:hypothetical protein
MAEVPSLAKGEIDELRGKSLRVESLPCREGVRNLLAQARIVGACKPA